MRIDVLSKEYPPEIYGGAGVHVAELVRALRAVDGVDARVHAFGRERDEAGTTGYADPAELASANAAIRTLGVDLEMVGGCEGTDVVHSHTWYANMAGHLAKLLHGAPHVVTAHSLEPMRPWKAEQLGGGYAVSSWAEKTAYEGADAVIGVSAAMRDDILRSYPDIDPARTHVVHNGIDTEDWQPVENPDRVRELGLDPDRPSVIFVGRITRQKGLPLFLRAAAQLPPDVQLILCAGRSRHQGDRGRGPRTGGRAGHRARRRGVDRGDAAARRRGRTAHRGHRVRLPVDLRAARHRQPRGDVVRDGCGRDRDRRHPGGGRRR